ncbi:TPA: hypothetical protein RQK93_004384 [Vibrio vulnificus]|uniref:hypothetical protein n=1 Tax=Vibrio vulnificus TaxID=672 RepID=UPI0028C60590|nr:hypothetical protein [Vibrio vulnificus]
MVKYIILLVAILPLPVLADIDDIKLFLGKNSNSEILKDLLEKNRFVPPYDDKSPLIELTRKCDEYLDSDPAMKTMALIAAKDEYLATAAGQQSFLGDLVKNSGGAIALQGYVSDDFLYLVNVANRSYSRESAYQLHVSYQDSPQFKKASEYSNGIHKQDTESKRKEKLEITGLCAVVDVFYTSLGGDKYSNTVETLRAVKMQINLQVNEDIRSKLDVN